VRVPSLSRVQESKGTTFPTNTPYYLDPSGSYILDRPYIPHDARPRLPMPDPASMKTGQITERLPACRTL
jgi:hypothetical protein